MVGATLCLWQGRRVVCAYFLCCRRDSAFRRRIWHIFFVLAEKRCFDGDFEARKGVFGVKFPILG